MKATLMLIPSAHTRREGEPREVWKSLPLRWAGLAEEAGSPEGWDPIGMGVFLMDTLMCWVVSVLFPHRASVPPFLDL